jgi:hypothetical protein
VVERRDTGNRRDRDHAFLAHGQLFEAFVQALLRTGREIALLFQSSIMGSPQ